MDRYHYSAYGLSISVTHALPGLSLSLANSKQVDVEIHLSDQDRLPADFKTFSRGAWSSLSLLNPHPKSRFSLSHSLDEPLISLSHPTGVEFIYTEDARTMWVIYHQFITLEYTAALLLNIGLAYNLQLRHFTCLHGSAVSINDQAVLFLGESGMGKSTTAAFFAQHGHPVITDDISALHEHDGRFWITPGYPSLRLFQSSFTPQLMEAQPTVRPIAPEWDKQYLALDDQQFQFAHAPLAISRIYLIAAWAERAALTPLPTLEAMAWLNRYNYLYHLSEVDAHRRNFAFLARLASMVPVVQLTLPNQIAHLDQLYDAVISSQPSKSMTGNLQ